MPTRDGTVPLSLSSGPIRADKARLCSSAMIDYMKKCSLKNIQLWATKLNKHFWKTILWYRPIGIWREDKSRHCLTNWKFWYEWMNDSLPRIQTWSCQSWSFASARSCLAWWWGRRGCTTGTTPAGSLAAAWCCPTLNRACPQWLWSHVVPPPRCETQMRKKKRKKRSDPIRSCGCQRIIAGETCISSRWSVFSGVTSRFRALKRLRIVIRMIWGTVLRSKKL